MEWYIILLLSINLITAIKNFNKMFGRHIFSLVREPREKAWAQKILKAVNENLTAFRTEWQDLKFFLTIEYLQRCHLRNGRDQKSAAKTKAKIPNSDEHPGNLVKLFIHIFSSLLSHIFFFILNALIKSNK